MRKEGEITLIIFMVVIGLFCSACEDNKQVRKPRASPEKDEPAAPPSSGNGIGSTGTPGPVGSGDFTAPGSDAGNQDTGAAAADDPVVQQGELITATLTEINGKQEHLDKVIKSYGSPSNLSYIKEVLDMVAMQERGMILLQDRIGSQKDAFKSEGDYLNVTQSMGAMINESSRMVKHVLSYGFPENIEAQSADINTVKKAVKDKFETAIQKMLTEGISNEDLQKLALNFALPFSFGQLQRICSASALVQADLGKDAYHAPEMYKAVILKGALADQITTLNYLKENTTKDNLTEMKGRFEQVNKEFGELKTQIEGLKLGKEVPAAPANDSKSDETPQVESGFSKLSAGVNESSDQGAKDVIHMTNITLESPEPTGHSPMTAGTPDSDSPVRTPDSVLSNPSMGPHTNRLIFGVQYNFYQLKEVDGKKQYTLIPKSKHPNHEKLFEWSQQRLRDAGEIQIRSLTVKTYDEKKYFLRAEIQVGVETVTHKLFMSLKQDTNSYNGVRYHGHLSVELEDMNLSGMKEGKIIDVEVFPASKRVEIRLSWSEIPAIFGDEQTNEFPYRAEFTKVYKGQYQ